jgi:ferric-dicitrate binding protein FerR (iron transport regulator)
MDKSRIAYLVHKTKLNQATNEEKEELESFWQQAQKDRTFLEALSEEERQAIKGRMFEEIEERIARLEGPRRNAHRRLMFTSPFLKIAASVAVILAAAFLWWQIAGNPKTEFHTAYGEHLLVRLPDSSTVILNGNSIVRYSKDWTEDSDREVWVEGEAFFDVVHTINNQRFIVHTGYGENVQVLGTRFNVKIRRGKTEVMLERGKVRFEVSRFFRNETVYLAPGELVSLEDRRLSKMTVNPLQYSGWTYHKLYFDHTELRDVVEMLEDTYGLSVVLDDERLASRKLSGEIDCRYVEDILAAIEASLNVEATRSGQTVILGLRE